MGFLSSVGDIALSILGGIADQSARSMDRQSRRRDLSDEQRSRYRDASENARNLADEVKERRRSISEDE